MCTKTALSVKDQKLAAKYGKLWNVLDMYKAVYGEKYLINAYSNPRVPVITADDNIQLYRWGLIPNFLTERKHTRESKRELITKIQSWRKKTYNARSEDIFKTLSYRQPIIRNRLIVPCTGLYEYHTEKDGSKTPYFIHLKDNELFSLAGIFDKWKNPYGNEDIFTFSVVTAPANKMMEWIHNGGNNPRRMPVILGPEDEKRWLQPGLSQNEIAGMLKTFPAEPMIAHAVKKDFIKKRRNDPSILEPDLSHPKLSGGPPIDYPSLF